MVEIWPKTCEQFCTFRVEIILVFLLGENNFGLYIKIKSKYHTETAQGPHKASLNKGSLNTLGKTRYLSLCFRKIPKSRLQSIREGGMADGKGGCQTTGTGRGRLAGLIKYSGE